MRKNESFYLWDFGGDLYQRQFWQSYLKNVPPSVIIYVVSANEATSRIQEAKLYLHTLMMDPIAADKQLIIVFNVYYAYTITDQAM